MTRPAAATKLTVRRGVSEVDSLETAVGRGVVPIRFILLRVIPARAILKPLGHSAPITFCSTIATGCDRASWIASLELQGHCFGAGFAESVSQSSQSRGAQRVW